MMSGTVVVYKWGSIMGPLKPLNTIVLWCTRGFSGPQCQETLVFWNSYTSGCCCFSSLHISILYRSCNNLIVVIVNYCFYQTNGLSKGPFKPFNTIVLYVWGVSRGSQDAERRKSLRQLYADGFDDNDCPLQHHCIQHFFSLRRNVGYLWYSIKKMQCQNTISFIS